MSTFFNISSDICAVLAIVFFVLIIIILVKGKKEVDKKDN
jgi:preprotein translocase subunit SecG